MGIAVHFRAGAGVAHVDKALRIGLYSREADVVRYGKKVVAPENWLVLFADHEATKVAAGFKAADVSGFRVYGADEETDRLYARVSSILDGLTSIGGAGLPPSASTEI